MQPIPRNGLIWIGGSVALFVVLCIALVLLQQTGVILRSSGTEVPTKTPFVTRTPKPTFTPVPSGPTLLPTAEAATPEIFRPTRTRLPTRRPTARPTATPRPTVVLKTPLPQYRFQSVNWGCVHSGQTFIQGTIYYQGLRVNGVTVAMSWQADGSIVDRRVSGADGIGFWSMIVNAYGSSPGQTRWVWVIEGTTDRRISDAVRFDFNNYNENTPASCWRGFVDFVQLF